MKALKRLVLVLAVIIAAVLAIQLYNGLEQTDTNPPVSDNSDYSQKAKAPDFTLLDLNGNEVSLSDYEGKKNIFLNFWATNCPYCKAEMPDMESVYKEYQDQDFIILAVNTGEGKDTVSKFIEKNNYSFPVLLDSELEAARIYKVSGIPVSIFIDKEGYIISALKGLITKEQMESRINYLIENS